MHFIAQSNGTSPLLSPNLIIDRFCVLRVTKREQLILKYDHNRLKFGIIGTKKHQMKIIWCLNLNIFFIEDGNRYQLIGRMACTNKIKPWENASYDTVNDSWRGSDIENWGTFSPNNCSDVSAILKTRGVLIHANQDAALRAQAIPSRLRPQRLGSRPIGEKSGWCVK